MTLILALDCADGLLLASDSQATISTGGQSVKAATEKLYCGAWTNIAWGASGSAALIQRVEQHLCTRYTNTRGFESEKPHELRKKLATEISRVVKPLVTEQYIQTAGVDLLASFLFVGHTQSGPLLVEVSRNMQDEDHLATGYVAIGSGDIFPYFALASLGHFNVRDRSLAEAKLIAHRVMDDAIRVAAQYLGPPIQMVEISKPASGAGVARRLTDVDLQVIADSVYTWKQLEGETLSAYSGMVPLPVESPLGERA